jgi:signal transduction histidine kinase
LLDSAIADIRRLAHGIYPPLLVSGGLSPALRAAAKQAAVPVHVELNGLPRYPSAVEAALYHYCSEALQNAAKHGGPGTAATITACADVRMLSIIVSDTGRGFDPARKGTGLANMSDRLAAIGGTLLIDSAPGRGTRIRASVITRAMTVSRQPAEVCTAAG